MPSKIEIYTKNYLILQWWKSGKSGNVYTQR